MDLRPIEGVISSEMSDLAKYIMTQSIARSLSTTAEFIAFKG